MRLRPEKICMYLYTHRFALAFSHLSILVTLMSAKLEWFVEGYILYPSLFSFPRAGMKYLYFMTKKRKEKQDVF